MLPSRLTITAAATGLKMPSPSVSCVDTAKILSIIPMKVLSIQVSRPTTVFMNHAHTVTHGEDNWQNIHASSCPNAPMGFDAQSAIVGRLHNHYASSEAVSTSFSDWSMNMPTIHMKK